MDKKDLDKDREERKQIQLEQSKHWEKFRVQERKLFNEVDLISIIARTKNNDDLQLLMEKMTDWVGSAKSDNARKTYIELLQAVYRIHSYCFNIETTVSQAIVMAKTSEEISKNTTSSFSKEKLQLMLKIKALEADKKRLENEIEFLNKNGV